MSHSDFTVRVMTRAELDVAIEWAAAEGWNPGLHDAASFYAADPAGFLVGLLDGEPVATISAVKYGNSLGFLGLYIVKPSQRGKGYGRKIWKEAMESLAGRNVGLDGVVEQQDNYRKSGFNLAFRNVRYEGPGGGATPAVPGLVPLAAVPWETVLAYDRPFFPDDRSAFLKAWINQPQGVGLGLVEKDRLVGYGLLRPCRKGCKIGPLFADTPAGADLLYRVLRTHAPEGDLVYIDMPESNPAAIELARRHQLRLVFETARMYTGPVPALPLARLFGITTFELG